MILSAFSCREMESYVHILHASSILLGTSMFKAFSVMKKKKKNVALLYRLSHDIVTLMWIATFRPLTAGLHQAMVSTGHVS